MSAEFRRRSWGLISMIPTPSDPFPPPRQEDHEVAWSKGQSLFPGRVVSLVRFLPSRQGLLFLVGIFSCCYALAVLWHVHSLADIGIRSAFGTSIKGTPRNVLPHEGGPLPQQGDRVVAVGDIPIRNWPDLLVAPQQLADQLEQAGWEMPPWVRRSREFNSEEKVTRILVQFERAGPGERTITFNAWCALDRLPLEQLVPTLLWFFLKLLLFVVGVLVLWKRPGDAAAVQFYLLCVVTLGAYIGGYHWTHIITNFWLISGFMVWALLLPAVTLHFYLSFPRPKRLLQVHPRWTLFLVYGPPVGFLLVLFWLYSQARWAYQAQAELQLLQAQATLLDACYLALGQAGLWYLASVVALLHSYRTVTDATERNQVKCILLGALLALVPISYSLYLALFEPDSFGAGGATWPMFAASVCLTAAFIVSFTRYRLMELDQILSSSVVYFLISFLAGVVYYAVVFVGALLFNQAGMRPGLSEPLTIGTTALVLLLILDLARSRLMRALDRRFYREKYHLDQTLQRMGEAIRQLVDPPTLLQRLLQAATDLLGIAAGAVFLRQGDPPGYRQRGAVGEEEWPPELPSSGPLLDALHTGMAVLARPRGGLATTAEMELRQFGGEVAQPLVHEGRLLGVMILGPRSGTPYRPEDLNLLGALAQITALALESAAGHQTIEMLNRDLQTKVEKIAEQQRRILVLQSQLRRLGSLRTAVSSNGTVGNGHQESSFASTAPDSGSKQAAEELPPAGRIVGSGPQVRQLLHLVRKVAATDTVVLIRGESGTGKELLAQAIHETSPRANKAFVKVHCAALSPTLLESELFGHVKGAFTGAHKDKIGRFELANGGTLFLDEIGDVSLEVQTKLLRVLQERVFERVGSSDPLKVDVRIIAATHQNLEELIQQGRFREDLYYRLNVFPITVPPLRQRREDIAELAQYFLRQAAQRVGKPIPQLDDDALVALKGYSWPGNIRQLENVLERSVVIAEGPLISLDDLPEEIRRALGPTTAADLDTWTSDLADEDFSRPLGLERVERAQREREQILQALAAAGGNKAQAARALGIPRSTLISRLKKYGVG